MTLSSQHKTLYSRVLGQLIGEGRVGLSDKVLVVCGGSYDALVLRDAGLQCVTIGNLDDAMEQGISPFEWVRLDAENLTYADGSFDWAFVHAGLHHCLSPHRALIEMMRVSKKGVVAFEARDSLLLRSGVRIGLVPDYETYSVMLRPGHKSGGLLNGPLPNYIYRWTEREVLKTVESVYPHRRNSYRFFYGLRLPTQRLAMSGGVVRALASVLGAVASVVQRVFPKQCNEFAFAIEHGSTFKPWMDDDGALVRADYTGGMDLTKYRRPTERA